MAAPSSDKPASPVDEATTEALDRLRAGIEAAVNEVNELRRKNEALEERVHDLQQRPEVSSDATVLMLDDGPEEVRQRIEQLIKTIDSRLAESHAAGSHSTNGS